MAVTVKPVQSGREMRQFLTLPWKIYRDDPLWIPPLLPQQRSRFDPASNPILSGQPAEAFIAWQDGQPVGTVAVAVDHVRNEEWDEDNAIFGYFESVNDYAVAEALLDTAAEWTRKQGKSRLWGPWRLDYEDSHGFLVKGWERPPALMCGHTPPYYAEFAERYGMRKARRDSVAFAYDIPDEPEQAIPPKLARIAGKLKDRTKVTIRQGDFSRWDEEIELAVDVLNRGLAVLGDARGFWSAERMRAHARDLRPVLDPAFVLLAEVDGRAVGWLLGIPNLNEAIDRANGLRHPWNAVQLWANIQRRPDCISLKSGAVDPQYWGRGIETLLGYQFAVNAIAAGYKWVDMSLTGEDNPQTPRIATGLGAVEYKRYRVYEIFV